MGSVLFKAQLGEVFLEVLIFFLLFFCFILFAAKPCTQGPNTGTENFTKISRHLWQRKTEKMFTSALLQGSCSGRNPNFLQDTKEYLNQRGT